MVRSTLTGLWSEGIGVASLEPLSMTTPCQCLTWVLGFTHTWSTWSPNRLLNAGVVVKAL